MFNSAGPIRIHGRELIPGAGPFVFGVLNTTPDSFSDGGAYQSTEEALEAGFRMADQGADAIDVGGESTRPGSQPVPADEQIRRTAAVISGLAERFGPQGPAISIDTRLATVAEAALDSGATIINDVSALREDPEMGALAAERGAGVILLHMQGTPENMQREPTYDDVIEEIKFFLEQRIASAIDAGISKARLLMDPGIGFGKRTDHNLQILGRIEAFGVLDVPVMVGPSRKRFIGEVLRIEGAGQRGAGTVAAVAACILHGVECVRVHDVAVCRQVADMCAAIRRGCHESEGV